MNARRAPSRDRFLLLRHAAIAHRRASRLPAALSGLLWSGASGLLFVLLNTLMRQLTLDLNPWVTQFLRYFSALVVMLPLVARSGLAAYRPAELKGHFTRGAVHTAGLVVWFAAVAHISVAETTAIGFTMPIFVMIGASLFFHEPMRAARWVCAGLGFAGVLVVVGPKLTGGAGIYTLVMLASAPIFAASFLLTKALTRTERTGVIVLWQCISITLFSLPMAVVHWQTPTAAHALAFLACGLLGSLGHYCLTQSFAVADISATQSVKFLDLLWAALVGWIVFADVPSNSTLVGGFVICASTLWLAHRESRARSTP